MSSVSKKIKENMEKLEIEKKYKLRPVSKCPNCHKFTVYENHKDFVECVRCGYKHKTDRRINEK